LLNYETHLCDHKAQWIVLLHGMGGSIRTWGKQVEYYRTQYHVLAIDLHGHGASRQENTPLTRTMEEVCGDIAQVMDACQVKKAHFASLSLGTMINVAFAGLYPQRVLSMVMGGGVLRFDAKTDFLLRTAQRLQNCVPYMWLYRFFAHILLPRHNHSKSRNIFVREAVKLGHAEFCAWLNFLDDCRDLSPYIQTLRQLGTPIPALYIMGAEDYLFLPETSRLCGCLPQCEVHVIPHCGHVCNIERWGEFNKTSMEFFQTADTNARRIHVVA
jgi:pimeloyl-ACP methyl ester carboxylesterase